MTLTVVIRAAAIPQWEALQAALRSSPPVPCMGDDRWTSESAAVREWAAWHCARCPVIELCGAFAEANQEVHGVWAGRDRSTLEGRRSA